MISQLPQHKDTLSALFKLCKQVNPYLDGKVELESMSSGQQSKSWLVGNEHDRASIQALNNDLRANSPDAGDVYYITRSWDLLCWQPMTIAFVAIYGLKQLPDFKKFKQRKQHNSVYGFVFQNGAMIEGEVELLIQHACKQLKPLFEHYRRHLNSLQRCRTGYVKRLLADLVLDNLLKVSQLIKNFNHQDLQRHTDLWFNAMELPQKQMQSLIINKEQQITHIRSSCCLTYKVNNDLCANCPKRHK